MSFLPPALVPNISGHVHRVQRKKGGVWYVKYRAPDPTSPSGRRQIDTALGPEWPHEGPPPPGYFDRRAAQAALDAILTDARRGHVEVMRTGVTFERLAHDWLVWDRQAGIHGHQGRPTDAFAAFCGQLKTGWVFCEPADPQAKGAVERLQGYAETNFEPGRRFANELDFQDQLDAWFAKVNARTHKTLRARPVDRLADELEAMAPLPDEMPDTARRWTMRVPPDPHLRFDTNDYSLDPGLVGRRVEVCVDQREVRAVALDTGELACRHARTFAKHRTVTALEHARQLRAGRRAPAEQTVEVRSLARYDQLIA
jgi:hypothetical protein